MLILNHKLINLWIAATLTSLFFYPLIAGLNENLSVFQWRTINTIELISIASIFTLIFYVVLFVIAKVDDVQIRCGLLYLIFIVPFSSFIFYFLEQIGYKSNLLFIAKYSECGKSNVVFISVFFATLLFLIIQYPRIMMQGFAVMMFVLSPVNIIFLKTLLVIRDSNAKIEITSSIFNGNNKTLKSNVYIFLFDELSYNYLYNNGVVNNKYKHFKYLSSLSYNYLSAHSPGKETAVAIPGLIMGYHKKNINKNYSKDKYFKLESDNLFAIAKVIGYKTYAFGPYLPYCQLLDKYIDGARSFSVYNIGNVDTTFSLFNPIKTTLLIWPRQKPFGVIKNIVASEWQRRQTDLLMQKTYQTIASKVPVFMFSHIYVTHVPFVFNRDGYYNNNAPYLQDSKNYSNAIEYADYLLGELINSMKKNNVFDSSEIIILADHNYRTMFPGQEYHIPLIIKNPYQNKKTDVFTPVHAEQVLKESVKHITSF